MEALRIEDLSIRFGGVQAVNSVSFVVEQGERLAIIGPNGAGKTTLFNLINGQLSPTSGRIVFLEKDVTDLATYQRAHLGISRAFQIISLLQNLTVLENALLTLHGVGPFRFKMVRPMQYYKEVFDDAADQLLRLGLWDMRDEPVSSLSYGDQRRLEIHLALAAGPRLLLLDEPSAGSTKEEGAEIIDIVRRLGGDITVLIVDHDMDMVFGLADRIIVLHYGEIIADGSPKEIQGNQRVREIYMGIEECVDHAGAQ
jgi:branched-chain amino acid transport system ATP-binding protein